jgi:hypothetical protein
MKKRKWNERKDNEKEAKAINEVSKLQALWRMEKALIKIE